MDSVKVHNPSDETVPTVLPGGVERASRDQVTPTEEVGVEVRTEITLVGRTRGVGRDRGRETGGLK